MALLAWVVPPVMHHYDTNCVPMVTVPMVTVPMVTVPMVTVRNLR